MPSEIITLDSIDFNVLIEGRENDPLVILSHALMANLHMWDSTVQALHAAGFRTLRYDHVGHGETVFSTPEAAEREYHFDVFVQHIHALSAAATPGKKPFAIIGCSMGGVLAVRYAQMFPGTLAKVICADAPGMTSLDSAKPLWLSRIAQFRKEGVEDLAKATVQRWMPDPCPDGTREAMLEQVRTCTFDGYRACATAIMNYDYEAELGRIQEEQVLILAGENDFTIGPKEVLVNIANKIRGARYVSMPNVGHLPPFHDPDEFNKIMLGFLTER